MRRTVSALAALLLLAATALAAASAPSPDPAQAVRDGCGRDEQAIFARFAPNWVYVGDASHPATGPPPPPRWASGDVNARVNPELAAHPAGSDLPFDHASYDFVFNLRPDSADADVLAGDPAAGTGNFGRRADATARLHSEWEERVFPSYAWPDRGDRVTMLGSWVWDCDHWVPSGERTEFHPLRVLWVHRRPTRGGSGSLASPRSPFGDAEAALYATTDKTPAGAHADCAHRTKRDASAFRQCLSADDGRQSIAGSYRFLLPAPPRPAGATRLAIRLADRGSTANAPRPRLRRVGSAVEVSFDILARDRRRLVLAKQVFVGWRPMPAASLPLHLRIAFRRLVVRRALDPGRGEWNLYWNVAGIWSPWSPRLLRPRNGDSLAARQVVDVYVGRRSSWRLFAFARECDLGALGSVAGPAVALVPCPRNTDFAFGNDEPGVVERRFRSPAAAVGTRTADSGPPSSCPAAERRGCYALEFGVALVQDLARRASRAAR